MATISTPVSHDQNNFGYSFNAILWNVFSTCTRGFHKIKDDANTNHDFSSLILLASDALKGTGTLFGGGISEHATRSLKNGMAIVDGTQVFCDLNFFVSGAWREATYFNIAQQAFIVTGEVLSQVVWFSELGFFALGTIAETLGAGASVFGSGFSLATGATCIMGTIGLGFFCMSINSAINFTHSENLSQKIYHALFFARAASQTGACAMFVYASVMGAALVSSAAIITALTISAMAFSVFASLYRNGSLSEVEKPLHPDIELYKPDIERDPNKLEKNGFMAAAKQAAADIMQPVADIVDCTDSLEKVCKAVRPLLFWFCKGIKKAGLESNSRFFQGLFEGSTNLEKELGTYIKVFGGINFFSRMNEWFGRNEKGDYVWKDWTYFQMRRMQCLTAGHFVDFLVFMEMCKVIELGALATKYSFNGLTIAPLLMAQPLFILGSAIFSFLKSGEDKEDAANAPVKASNKSEKWKNKPENCKTPAQVLDVPNFKDSLLQGRFATIEVEKEFLNNPASLKTKKHILVNRLLNCTEQQQQKDLLRNNINALNAVIAEDENVLNSLKSGWLTWPSRWGEMVDLTKKINEHKELLKVNKYYQSHTELNNTLAYDEYHEGIKITVVPNRFYARREDVVNGYLTKEGIKIDLPDNINATLSPETPYVVSAGTMLTLANGKTIKLRSDVELTLEAGEEPISLKDLKAGKEKLITSSKIKFNVAPGQNYTGLIEDTTALLMNAGEVKIILHSADSIQLIADQAKALPIGTELKFSNGKTITITVPTTFALKPGAAPITLTNNVEVSITAKSCLRVQGGSVANAYLFKCISKMRSWSWNQGVSARLAPKNNFKSDIVRWYEAGKGTLCIGGIIAIATAATAAAPVSIFLAAMSVPVGALGLWNVVLGAGIDKLKKRDINYQAVSKSVY